MASSCGTRGRGSAMAVGALVTFLVLVHGAMAADYQVNGDGVWTFNPGYQAWADSITFQAGDTITFTYNPAAHDVIILNTKEDFDNCVVGSPKNLYKTGNDKIPLAEGTTYFTCGFDGHCGGMKFSAVVAQAAAPPPTTPAAPPPTTPASPPPTTPAGSPPSTPPTASTPTPTSTAPTTTPPASGPSTKTPSPGPSTKTPSPHKAPAPAPSSAVSVKAAAAATFVGAAALALVMI